MWTETALAADSVLNDVPRNVGIFTFVFAFVAVSTSRVPISMSSTTRNISTNTQSSDARTVAERGWNVRHVISPKSSPGPRSAIMVSFGRSIDASIGMKLASTAIISG